MNKKFLCGLTKKKKEGLPMKRTGLRAVTFTMIIVFGTLGNSLPTTQQATPTITKSPSEKTGASPDSGPFSLATAVVNPLKIDPKQPSRKYTTKSARGYNLEKVEVLARSVTFPQVIKQGQDMMSVDYPSDAILCLDAAYYAGKVMGLMWAMDRDTVEEHELYWTIDDAGNLFNECLIVLLQQAFADQNASDKNQLQDVKEELAEQIQIIQGKLRKAQNVKIKGAELSVGGRF